MDTEKERVWYKGKERVQEMEKFTKEQKEQLEQNPAIYAVLTNQVVYSKEFKAKALKEYSAGKSANEIFQEAGLDVTILSKRSDYASKTISKWRLHSRENINIHYPKKKNEKNESAYQKLLKRNEYLEAENEFLKKLQALNKQFR